jgi:putative (di)nucleoside polyphosphate hydrolase
LVNVHEYNDDFINLICQNIQPNLLITFSLSMTSKPFRQAVMAIITKEDGTFLLGSSPRDEGYKFPQGGIDPGETAQECLKRELFEELGVLISDEDILGILNETISYPYPDYKPYSKIYCGQEMTVFIVKHNPSFNWTPQDDEFDEMIWIKPEKLIEFNCVYRMPAYQKALELWI